MGLEDVDVGKQELDILEEFEQKFKKLEGMGFIDSRRLHDTGIGKTAEDLLGIIENNKTAADYKGVIELKSHRELSESMVTLFTKSPEPRGANTIIRNFYGYPDKIFTDKMVLHVTFSGDKFNRSERGAYGFKFDINKGEDKIFIQTKNMKSGEIEYVNVKNKQGQYVKVFYPLKKLRYIIEHKCKFIILIGAERKKEDGKELFHFNTAKLLSGLTYNKFIELVAKGSINYDFRLGVYKSGNRIGKNHDHGSGFRFFTKDLNTIFKVTDLVDP